MNMSLEEIEKELREVEVVPENKLGLGIVTCFILYTISSIAVSILTSGISGLTNISELSSLLVETPVKGVDIIKNMLSGNYSQAILLTLPIILAGIIGGAMAKSARKGALAGLVTWIILFIIGFGIIISKQNISTQQILSSLENYLDKTLFIDTVLISIFGAIGGAIREEKIKTK